MGESMDSEVSKAVNKVEEAPKRKHVRNIVILCWRSNGALQFFSETGKAIKSHKEPNAICGYKALCVIHSVIQEGPPRCREDSQHQLGFLQGIANEFKRATTDRMYGPAIVEYVTFLTEKVNFHKAHPEFEGNLNLDEYMKKIAGGVPRPEKLMEVIGHLLDLQEACLKMDRHVFSVKSPKDLTECRVAALIPLTLESYAIYTMVVFLLKKLVDLIEDVNVFSFLTQRFYTQYMDLKNMFFEIANVKYVASIISVPTLPRDPPQFLQSKKKAPKNEPESQPAPNALNPQLMVQPPPWGNQAATVTTWQDFAPPPPPVVVPPPVDDDFASLRDNRREKEFEDMRNRIRQLEEELARERAEKEMMRRELEALRAENAMLKANMQALQEAYLRERRVLTENELDAAVDAINGQLRRLDDPTYQGNQQATAESILASQAALMKAVEELERAARSGDQAALMNAVRAVTAALARLLDDVKGASRLTDDPLVKQALFDAARAVGAALAALLEAVKYGDAASFGAAANSMRSALGEMGGAAERLANKDATEEMSEAEGLKLEKFAESELMAAARAITEAAESIMRAKAARSKDLSAEAMQTGDAIMDSAFAITTVTGNLIKMAMISQQERVTKGRASNLKTFYKKERTFAEGLISAAKAVAAATVELVAVANKAANGEVDEEAMIAVSKSITAATAQLVAASRVTSDSNSDNQRNLEEASKAVVRATQMLVEALRNAPETLKSQADSVRQADIWLKKANQSAIQHARAKQEIMAAIARADKEKGELQKKLFDLNKAEYKPQ